MSVIVSLIAIDEIENLKARSGLDFYLNSDSSLDDDFKVLSEKVDFLLSVYRDEGADWFDKKYGSKLKEAKKLRAKILTKINQLEKIEDDENSVDDVELGDLVANAYKNSNFHVGFVKHDDSVTEILKFLKRGTIKLDPSFQRDDVWDKKQRSTFIESLILEVPIPPLFINVESNGSFVLIDGRQRVTTIRNFMLGDEHGKYFKLQGLDVLKDLEGKGFRDIDFPQIYRNRIEDFKLQTYRINSGPTPLVIYDIFRRINTAGTKLFPQEIRNAIYQGPAINLVNSIANSEEFLQSINYSISQKRMRDREAVLRMLAPIVLGLDAYPNSGNLDEYLQKTLYFLNYKINENELRDLEQLIYKMLKLASSLFGKMCFRSDPNGINSKKINIALVDSISFVLVKNYSYFTNLTENKKEQFLQNYYNLFESKKFLECIGRRAYTRKLFLDRIDMLQDIILEVG